MFYFWPKRGVYTLVASRLDPIISHMRNLGGDRSQWCVLAATNQGLVDVPILPEWFES